LPQGNTKHIVFADFAPSAEWEKAWHPELAEPEIAIRFELAALRAALLGNDS
jgi:hypothetical protein